MTAEERMRWSEEMREQQCAYRDELERLHQRAEQAERVGNDAATHWKGLADKYQQDTMRAEKERDEACEAAERLRKTQVGLVERARRAEADNAAMLDALSMVIAEAGLDQPSMWTKAMAVRDADHPGAALLELDRVVREYLNPDNKAPDLFPVREALAKVGALKVAP